MKDNLYSIGQISKLLDISVQAIRLYQKLELIIPAYIDPQTNYRYYDDGAINDLWSLSILKSAGFSLKEIKQLENLNIQEIKNIYKNKSIELKSNIEKQIATLKYMERQIHAIDTLHNCSNEFFIKTIDARYGYSISASNIHSTFEHFKILNELKKNSDLHIDIAYQPARYMSIDKSKSIHLKNFFAINLDQSENFINKPNVSRIEAGTFLCANFYGSKNTAELYFDMINYIESKKFTLRGDAIELLLLEDDISKCEKNLLREIQIAIVKN